MGNIRTSRPIYQDGFVMEFYVRKNQVMYSIKVWNKEGTNQGLLKVGIVGQQKPQKILDQALQNFQGVEIN